MNNLFFHGGDNEEYQTAAEELIDAVEPIAGFRPEDTIQAVSLLVDAYLKLTPAMEALQQLASMADLVRYREHDSD
ncbi:MAG: hypothetical protein A2516_11780 [Alphaproteobacteria bacterium RIFOXYD12_FULL_60_8]|nr:MAG: hypothetical protein A2516_11780 [Alphaproteobacteria bacterium RIFOXYD12_FULL_60_8]